MYVRNPSVYGRDQPRNLAAVSLRSTRAIVPSSETGWLFPTRSCKHAERSSEKALLQNWEPNLAGTVAKSITPRDPNRAIEPSTHAGGK